MLRNLVVLLFATTTLGAIRLADRKFPLDGRIVGGSTTNIISFPWQASLQIKNKHMCGAIIYSSKILITAAHCVSASNINNYTIRAGTSTWNSGGIVVKVAAFKIHDNYVTRSSENDVAVMRLEEPFTFSSTIRPISLASVEPTTGTPAVISGWGTTSSGAADLSPILRFANVKIIDSKLCASDAYSYGNAIKPNMICASAPGKDSCQEDSGGPMVSGGELVGVVSFGRGCADAAFPGVYANVAVLRKWIESAVLAV